VKETRFVGTGSVMGIFIVACDIVALVGGGHKNSKSTHTPTVPAGGAVGTKAVAVATE